MHSQLDRALVFSFSFSGRSKPLKCLEYKHVLQMWAFLKPTQTNLKCFAISSFHSTRGWLLCEKTIVLLFFDPPPLADDYSVSAAWCNLSWIDVLSGYWAPYERLLLPFLFNEIQFFRFFYSLLKQKGLPVERLCVLGKFALILINYISDENVLIVLNRQEAGFRPQWGYVSGIPVSLASMPLLRLVQIWHSSGSCAPFCYFPLL